MVTGLGESERCDLRASLAFGNLNGYTRTVTHTNPTQVFTYPVRTSDTTATVALTSTTYGKGSADLVEPARVDLTFTQDIRPPAVTITLTAASATSITVQWSAVDPPPSAGLTGAYDVAYRTGGGDWAGWLTQTVATEMALNPTDAKLRYEFRVTAQDRAGNTGSATRGVGSALTYLPLILGAPPQPQIVDFRINENAQTTDRVTVTLSLTVTAPPGDVVAAMRFQNDGERWGDWMPFTSTWPGWTIQNADGLHQVCAQVRGGLGGIAETRCDHIYLLANGGFELEPDWLSWSHEGDAGFATTIVSGTVTDHAIRVGPVDGSRFALLGDPSYSNGSVPVGSARAWRSIVIPDPALHPRLTIWYRLFTFDQIRSGQGRWLDSFEIYVGDVNWDAARNPVEDDLRRQERCVQFAGAEPDAALVKSGGLVFCQGLPKAPTPGPEDLGWRSVTLDLSAFTAGDTATISLANFNRADGWYNTWTYVDDLTMTGDW
jgi:hypothetical protein